MKLVTVLAGVVGGLAMGRIFVWPDSKLLWACIAVITLWLFSLQIVHLKKGWGRQLVYRDARTRPWVLTFEMACSVAALVALTTTP